MHRCTNVLILEEWRKRLHEEFTEFHSELSQNIACYKRKQNLSCEIHGTKKVTLGPIIRLSNAVNHLAEFYRDFDDDLANLVDDKLPLHRIKSDLLHEIQTRINGFQRELGRINKLIEDSLFKTKMEQFCLKIKSIIFTIVNFITGRCHEHRFENETSFFAKGPGHYITPLRTLPHRAENSLFFTQKITRILEKIQEQREQAWSDFVHPSKDKTWPRPREISFGTYEQYKSIRH